ncbi:MAG: HAD family phosphatase [Verrucomicrobiota bacterium]|jgi:FMN phosphatase YigB (HAD superfamily)
MPPAIIFDLGKVLVDFDYSIAARKVAARSSKKSLSALHDFLSHSPLLVDYERGRLTREDFFESVHAAIGFYGSLEEFGGYFADIFTEMPGTIALQAELRLRGLKTYIFSNTNDLAIEHVRRNFPFFKNFDGYIFSYEVGAIKPQPEIYEALEKLTGRRGADLVYLDDRPENIAAGAARGWRTILHESPEKTRRALAAMGVVEEKPKAEG